jgi:hypothetical protein
LVSFVSKTLLEGDFSEVAGSTCVRIVAAIANFMLVTQDNGGAGWWFFGSSYYGYNCYYY